MNDAPHVALARTALIHAARRLAAALGPRSEAGGAEAHIRALARAVVAYVATYGTGRDRGELASMVASRVRSALGSDDVAGYPEAVVGLVVDIARQAVDDALLE
jgi:hypothetical protein